MSTIDAQAPFNSRPDPTLPGSIGIFFLGAGVLAGLNAFAGLASLPQAALPIVNVALNASTVIVAVFAIFFGANTNWKPSLAALFLVGGLALQVASVLATMRTSGQLAALSNALSQFALATWCTGLGALLATLVREKNLLIPIAVFLVLYDAFLVLSPVGPTAVAMQAAPQVLPAIALQVPIARSGPPVGKADVVGYIGPADLVFLGAFFVALFRFKLQTRRTLALMVPLLLLYLAIVLFTGVSLPALVPIGLALIVSNWREFHLSKDEWTSTAVIAALGLGLLIWGLTRPAPEELLEPSPKVAAPDVKGSAEKRAPTVPSPPLSGDQNAPGSTQGPQ